MIPCAVCGNEADSTSSTCRFCGAGIEPLASEPEATVTHKVVNIEQGRPLVETALRRMENELLLAKSERVRVVTLIHGYGSSGKGGKIRKECRKVLDHLLQKNLINQVIAGENFRKRTGPGKALLRRYPDLLPKCAADFSNRGITIVVL